MNSSQGLSVFSGNDYQEKKSSSSLIGFFDEPHAPAQNVSTQRASSKLAGFFDEPPMPAQSTTFAHAGRKPYVDDFEALIRSEGAQVYAPVIRAIYKQESGGGTNARTSTDGARGGMQVMPATFRQYARPGESIDNPEHNVRVGIRIIKDLGDRFGNDAAKIATGYFSGPGNVNPGAGAAWKHDRKDGNGKSVSSYAQDVVNRVNKSGAQAIGAAPRGQVVQSVQQPATGAENPLLDISQVPSWASIQGSQRFQSASPQKQAAVKQRYFDEYIAPIAKHAGLDIDGERKKFLMQAGAATENTERTWGEAVGDTGKQLIEGTIRLANTPVQLFAPGSATANYLNAKANEWHSKQSEDIKRRQAAADEKIARFAEEGQQKAGMLGNIANAFGATVEANLTDPALAARTITTNLPSILVTAGLGKLAQAGLAYQGMNATRAAQIATTATGAINAISNAGDARGDAYQDIKNTLIRQGVSPDIAEEIALKQSVPSAVIGGGVGYLSGKSGLESAVMTKQAAREGAERAAAAAIKAGVKSAASEMLGEIPEEVLPQVATNLMAGRYDDRPVAQGVGRTIADTMIGAAPGSALAGSAGAYTEYAARQQQAQMQADATQALSNNETPGVVSVQPPAENGQQNTQQPAVAVQPPNVHPTVEAADAIVRELAQEAGMPLELVLPTSAIDPAKEARVAELSMRAMDGEMEAAERAELAALQQDMAQEDMAQPQAPQQEQPVARPRNVREARALHRQTDILTANGGKVAAQWDVVEADSVQASLKEGVSQPRDRTRAASNAQVSQIAANPDWERLSDTSKTMDYGAPTLSSDNLIVGGNGRFEGVSQAYENGTADAYRAALEKNSWRLGLDGDAIRAMRKPVLVRRITENADTRQLAIQSNQPAGLQMSDMEQAALDAERMQGLERITVTDTGDISLTASNRQAIQHALGSYSTNEVAGMVGADGSLSQSGLRRVRNAILYRAYGKSETLARLIESPDADMKNVGTALVRAAGALAQVQDGLGDASIPAEFGIATDLTVAIETLSALRAEGMNLDEFLAQADMFGGELTAAQTTIIRMLADNLRSAKNITAFLQDYAQQVMSLQDSENGLFGDVPVPTKTEVLERARQQFTPGQGRAAATAPELLARAVGGDRTVQAGEGHRPDSARQSGDEDAREPGAGASVAEGRTEGGQESIEEAPRFSRSAMKDIDANIRRGREALARAVTEKTSVHRAMFRNGLGWVDFVWGDEGRVKASGKTSGAMGLAHILEARQRKDGMSEPQVLRLLDDVVSAIAQGEEVRRYEFDRSEKLVVAHEGVEAILTRDKGSNAWLLSGWEIKTPSHARRAGYVAPSATTLQPTTARRQGGEGDAAIVPLQDDDSQVPRFNRKEQDEETTFRAPEVRNAQGQLLAPNGRPSELNERQWHQVRSPQFKAWFGDWEHDPENASKVVDENGEPMVVYHGTSKRDAILDGGFKKGWTHLTDSKGVADSYQAWIKNGDVTPGTLDLYVKANNPAYYEAQGQKYTEIGHKVFRATSDAERGGHDAIIITNIRDNFDSSVPTSPHTTVVAFSPNQIKSATDNIGAFDADNDDIRFQRAWHGTPHRGIEKTGFRLNKIGTGEGAQVYGWGMYFAGQKEVAEHYRQKLSVSEDYVDGELLNTDIPKHMLAWALREESGNAAEAKSTLENMALPGGSRGVRIVAQAAIELLNNGERPTVERVKPDGQLYQVEIPEDSDLLDWDKPLSKQPQKVRKIIHDNALPMYDERDYDAMRATDGSWAIYRINQDTREATRIARIDGEDARTPQEALGLAGVQFDTGRQLYEALSRDNGGPRAASELLLEHGIPGLRYLDGNSRTDGKGTHNYVIWDESLLTPEAAEITPMYSRSETTKAAYEQRIDELFQDGAKANRVGARVLDRSDMLGLLGYADKPVLLAEGKLIAGRDNHPHMTADVWKKIPEWLDNPAAVFKSDTDEGLVFIAPETVAGSPVSMIVSLDTDGRNALNVHLLLNAYDRSSSTPFMRWINDGLLQYVDKKKFPALFDSVVGRRLPDTALQNKPGMRKILTEKNLAGWRKERALLSNQSSDTTGAPHDNRIIRDDSPDTQRAVGLLNRFFEGRGGDPVSFQGVRTEGIDSVVPLAQALGAKVVGVKVREGLTAQQLSAVERFNGARYQGYIYLDADTQRPHLAVLGHEMAHEMRAKRPDLYDRMVEAIRPYVKQKEYGHWALTDVVARKEKSFDKKREEFIGEVLSDGFMDPVFWRALGNKNKELLVQVQNFLARMLQKIAATVGYTRKTEAYLTDYERVMQIAGEVMAEYGLDQGKFHRMAGIDVRFSRALDRAADAGPADKWNAPEPSKLDEFIYTFQDKHINLKRVQEAINRFGQINEQFDAYQKEELYHGRVAARTEKFLNREVRPLLMDMRLKGLDLGALEAYLWARHAKERNAQIAKVNPEMPDGGSGLTNAQVDQYLAGQDVVGEDGQVIVPGLQAEHKPLLDKLAARVDAIIRGTEEVLLQYGLETRETIEAWRMAYAHYVPLHREDMDSGTPIGTGFSVKGSASKRATGSSRKVVDILAHVALQREAAITRGEKNRVGLALYGLALENPNADFWAVDKVPQIKSIDKRTGMVMTRPDHNYKSRNNVLAVRIGGQDRVIVFNERNQRAMRMVESLKNLDAEQLGWMMGKVAKATRYLSAINTQYNPVFGIVNGVRDVQSAVLNISSTQLRGKAWQVLKAVPAAMRAIWKIERQGRSGTAYDQIYDDMQMSGGTTGYREIFRMGADRAKALQAEFDGFNAGRAKKALKAFLNVLDQYNTAIENGTRLAAYKVALENGKSKDWAASVAKNITVNFNRKGKAATEIGAWYAFFNAAVQGSARTLETLKGPAGKKIIAGGVTLGMLQALVAAIGFDDDEWEDIPEFQKQRNFVLPTGDNTYVMFPYPLGFNVLPNLGRIPAELMLAGGKGFGDRVLDLMSVFLEAANPLGSATLLQTLAPSVADPVVALAENKSFAGTPIAKEDVNPLQPTPGFARAKDTSSHVSRGLAKGINWATGGTKYTPGIVSPTPDQLDYIFGSITGGAGRELNKAYQVTELMAQGVDVPENKKPLISRFVGTTDGDMAISARYWRNVKEINAVEQEVKGRIKDGENPVAYMREHPVIYIAKPAKRFANQIQKMRSERHRVEFDDKITETERTERLKKLDADIIRAMQEYNKAVADAKKQKAEGK